MHAYFLRKNCSVNDIDEGRRFLPAFLLASGLKVTRPSSTDLRLPSLSSSFELRCQKLRNLNLDLEDGLEQQYIARLRSLILLLVPFNMEKISSRQEDISTSSRLLPTKLRALLPWVGGGMMRQFGLTMKFMTPSKSLTQTP